jgi:hypothetical protein
MDWRHKAVCRDEDPELFFPVGNSGPALAQIADAKLVCNRCSVTTEPKLASSNRPGGGERTEIGRIRKVNRKAAAFVERFDPKGSKAPKGSGDEQSGRRSRQVEQATGLRQGSSLERGKPFRGLWSRKTERAG